MNFSKYTKNLTNRLGRYGENASNYITDLEILRKR